LKLKNDNKIKRKLKMREIKHKTMVNLAHYLLQRIQIRTLKTWRT